MKTWFGWLMICCTLVLVGFAWTHRHHVTSIAAAPFPEPVPDTQNADPIVGDAKQSVTVTGPLADYMARQKPANIETLKQVSVSVSHEVVASDHVGGSVVGTSASILHKTFAVTGVADLAFDVPAHAATPRLHGTYKSYAKQGGVQTSDETADVEFLLLSEAQFGDLLNGHAGDAIFAAEDAHDQEVNTSLPPTRDKAVKYYLVFRNNSRSATRKIVQADFTIDF